jgi:beta-N-acetylhexosaminidase
MSAQHGVDPAIFGIDQEGGMVRRVKEPEIDFPSAFAMASLGEPGIVEEVGWLTGGYLREHGVDIDLAPVADTLFWPEDEAIATRSFGSDPKVVAKMTVAFLKGLQRAFVLGAAKHFPGHGHAFMDTHLHPSLAPQDEGFSERFQRGLWPFRALVASGVPIIIPSHVRYPAYDPDLPATFSQILLKGLLREGLGFQGAILSDDLLMQAALAPFQGDIAEAAVRAFLAGCDVLTIGPDKGRQALAIHGFSLAVQSGRIPARRLEEARVRIGRLVSSVLSNRSLSAKSTFPSSQKRLEVAKRLSRSIIRVFDPNARLPFLVPPKGRVLVVEGEPSEVLSGVLHQKGLEPVSVGFSRAKEGMERGQIMLVRMGTPPQSQEVCRCLEALKGFPAGVCVLSTGVISRPLPGFEGEVFVWVGSLTPIALSAALECILKVSHGPA